MASIGWLHLADLHWTLRRPGFMAPAVRAALQEDLARLHRRAGPWDLVIVAGDLSYRGASEELVAADQALGWLLSFLRELGSDPCLLAVPGNHDLSRPRDPSPSALRALRRWHEDPSVREEFWNDPESPARRLVDRALEPYERWWNKQEFPPHVRVRRGLLPGDFTATVEKDGLRFGVAGLCTTFLQVTGDDYEGRLAVSPHQLTVAAGGDVPAWVAQHDAAILVTHHPASWLAEDERRRFDAAIHPAGRFTAHLSAHLHDKTHLIEEGERVQVQCESLLGIESWEDRRGNPGERRFGYSAAKLSLEEGWLRVFPRTWRGERWRPASDLVDLDDAEVKELPVTRFPRVEEPGASPLPERAALRDALASFYRSPDDVRRLAAEAGFRFGNRRSAGAAVDLWHAAVTEAEHRERLSDLVKIARLEYPGSTALEEAWAAYERASASVARPRSPRHGTEEEKLADTLCEELAKLPSSAFEAVVSTLALSDDVPGTATPQTTRAMAVVRLMERQSAAGLQRLMAVMLHVRGTKPSVPPRAPLATDDDSWLPVLLVGVLSGVTVGFLLGLAAANFAQTSSERRRSPTRSSVARLLAIMFADERDFDGFVLDHYPAVYRRFTNGMNRAYRIDLLLQSADPADIVTRLKRSHSSIFTEHERVLDYEDPAEAAPSRARTR